MELKVCVVGGSGKKITRYYAEHNGCDIPQDCDDLHFEVTTKIYEKMVQLHVWEWYPPEGRRLIPSIIPRYFRSAEGVVVVYDVSDPRAFDEVQHWIEMMFLFCGCYHQDTPRILVGHKYNQYVEYTEDDRVIEQHIGEALAKRYEASFIEVDSNTGENVEEAFITLAQSVIKSPGKKGKMIHWLMEENSRLTSAIPRLKKNIEGQHKKRKTSMKKEREYRKKAEKLHQQIDKKQPIVQNCVERVAEAKDRAYRAELRLKEQRDRMADVVLRVRDIEGRVSELQDQLRTGGKPNRERQPFWVVGPKEIEWNEKDDKKGTWGTTNTAIFRGLKVAAKYIHTESVISDYNQESYCREISIAARIRHPNIVQFIGATVEGTPIVLTELMTTTLKIQLEKQPLVPDQITSISLDIARALLYLHLMTPDVIIHRDVSSTNVLLNPGPRGSWLAKLSNCGSANYLRHVSTQNPGHHLYAAPEASSPSRQSTKMDVFSYGVLLLEMWCHQIPEVEQRKAVLEGLEQGNAKEMIERCLQHDPSTRPGMTDILKELQ